MTTYSTTKNICHIQGDRFQYTPSAYFSHFSLVNKKEYGK